ncbi:MAG: outer membrane protein transport protein [Ghiorsea sp.]
MKHEFFITLKLLVLAMVFAGHQAWAGGAFSNEDLTASGAGVANAVVASADDMAAAMYNPAGLAWQDGVQALIGNHSRYRTLSVQNNGVSSSGTANLTDLSYFAMAWKPEASDLGASFSMVTPFAARTDWSGTFASPSALGEMNLNTQRYAVDAFWRIRNGLAVSMGTDWYDSSIILNSGNATFSDHTQGGMAGHLGIRWQAAPSWILGATYRQASTLSFENANASVLQLDLPEELTIGVMHDVADRLRLELDVKQTAWSGLQRLDVMNANVVVQSLPLNFRDTLDVMLGATWFWRDNTQLRFGYALEKSANQSAGFQPAIADLTGHRFSVGFGGMMSGMHLDVAWAGVYYPDKVTSGTWAGTYQDSRYSLMFSLSKEF